MLLSLICLLTAPQEETTRVKVVNGRVEGVFNGWSPVTDLWGNSRRGLWTLRRDGTLLFGAPEGSFEEFAARELTADEKKECGTYAIDGGTFTFTKRDGSAGEGTVEYDADGCIKVIKASALRYFALRRGISFDLAGHFASVTSVSSAGNTNTSVHTSYTFHKNGLFVLESLSNTTVRSGSAESMHGELRAFFGAEAKDRIGTFEVKGSGLTLTFDSGVKRKLFIGMIGGVDEKDGTVLMMLGRSIYEGAPGRLPSVNLPTCKADQFELALPKDWTSAESESGGRRLFTISPSEPGLAILALGLDVDAWATAGDAETEKELRALIAGWVGKKLTSAGDVEPLTVDGASAVRIPMQFDREGTTVRVDGIYAVKAGRAMLLVALGTVEGAKARAGDLRVILNRARFAVDETAKAETADVEFRLAKAWKTAKVEQEGASTVALTPTGVKEGEFFAAMLSQATALKSAADKKGIAWLRQQVEEAIPGLQAQGEPELFTVGDAPAVGLRYAAKTDAGDLLVVVAYNVVLEGRAATLLAGGKAAVVTKHAGAARRAFETVRVKR